MALRFGTRHPSLCTLVCFGWMFEECQRDPFCDRTKRNAWVPREAEANKGYKADWKIECRAVSPCKRAPPSKACRHYWALVLSGISLSQDLCHAKSLVHQSASLAFNLSSCIFNYCLFTFWLVYPHVFLIFHSSLGHLHRGTPWGKPSQAGSLLVSLSQETILRSLVRERPWKT